jgi:hypothetical protein
MPVNLSADAQLSGKIQSFKACHRAGFIDDRLTKILKFSDLAGAAVIQITVRLTACFCKKDFIFLQICYKSFFE